MATLETFAQRIPAEALQPIAAQLPAELQDFLHRQTVAVSHPFSLKEFYQRVSQREDVSPEEAVMHVRAVFAVLSSAITPHEFGLVRRRLSHDYEELFVLSS